MSESREGEKRPKVLIIGEILKVCATPVNKSTVMRKANVNSKDFPRYLEWLYLKGLIKAENSRYVATKEGAALMVLVERLTDRFELYSLPTKATSTKAKA